MLSSLGFFVIATTAVVVAVAPPVGTLHPVRLADAASDATATASPSPSPDATPTPSPQMQVSGDTTIYGFTLNAAEPHGKAIDCTSVQVFASGHMLPNVTAVAGATPDTCVVSYSGRQSVSGSAGLFIHAGSVALTASSYVPVAPLHVGATYVIPR